MLPNPPNIPSEISDADRLFAESLKSMVPKATKLSVATTFYHAGFAAASALPVTALPLTKSSRRLFSLKFAAAIAAGLLVGCLGYQLGSSAQMRPNHLESEQIAKNDLRHPTYTTAESPVDSKEINTSVASSTEDSALANGMETSPAINVRFAMLSWLLPNLNQRLSLGSLGQGEFELTSATRVYHHSVERPTITIMPRTSLEMVDAMLAQ